MKPLIDAVCKTCRLCGESKPLPAFHPNKQCSFGVVATCRDCTRERISKWYKDNRKQRQTVANKARQDRKRKAVEQFGGKCLDCQQVFPDCVFEFHHLDPSQKDMSPANASPSKWEKELTKCVMLCANCHRIRHHASGKE